RLAHAGATERRDLNALAREAGEQRLPGQQVVFGTFEPDSGAHVGGALYHAARAPNVRVHASRERRSTVRLALAPPGEPPAPRPRLAHTGAGPMTSRSARRLRSHPQHADIPAH